MENRTTIQLSTDLRKKLKILASKRDISYQELLSDMISVFRELNKENTIISIPKKLAAKIKTNLKDTDFNSISEYTTFLLRLMLYEKAEKEKINERIIKQKLKALGYI